MTPSWVARRFGVCSQPLLRPQQHRLLRPPRAWPRLVVHSPWRRRAGVAPCRTASACMRSAKSKGKAANFVRFDDVEPSSCMPKAAQVRLALSMLLNEDVTCSSSWSLTRLSSAPSRSTSRRVASAADSAGRRDTSSSVRASLTAPTISALSSVCATASIEADTSTCTVDGPLRDRAHTKAAASARSSTSLISLAWSGAANGDPHASAKAAAAAEATARPPREATAAGASASAQLPSSSSSSMPY